MPLSRLKVATILGTRPEIIRLSRVMAALDEYTDHKIVHTGQNYDYELNEVFFKDLSIRKPDYFLGVDTTSVGTVLGGTLIETETVLRSERPDAVLILGDTNSSIAGLMAKRLKIPVYHMEAGNRCFDLNVPEEINRRILDHLADFNLVYTEHARRHLLSEGLPHRRIYLTGSPMREVMDFHHEAIELSSILDDLNLQPDSYFLVSLHREENVDRPETLRGLLESVETLCNRFDKPAIVSTHPRTRNRLSQLGDHGTDGRIQFLKPFGFHDYNKLQKNASCVLSDSGTISEESAILRFPAVTLRNAIERPEAVDTGSIVITGLETDRIVDCVDLVTTQFRQGRIPPLPAEYAITNFSQRVVHLVMGTAHLSNRWDGIEGCTPAP